MSMLSALARSPEGKALLDFAKLSGLPDDWEDPKRHLVTAKCSGHVLDNNNPPVPILDVTNPRTAAVNEELLVHLSHPSGACVANLNTVLALACAYIRYQYRLAGEVLAQESNLKRESTEQGDDNEPRNDTDLP